MPASAWQRPLAELFSASVPVLMEGAVVERVRRGAPRLLDPLLMNAPLIYVEAGRVLLRQIYNEYLEIGRSNDLPLLSLTPTWRTNPERVAASAFAGRDLNGDAVRFLQDIRKTFGVYASRVYIGGLMGCRGDAYKPEEALPREVASVFHEGQARALAGAGADYLMASTMPEIHEALGMSEALASTGCPYLVSFIVRPSGLLLDGTPMDEAMSRVDEEVSPRPLGYLVNCVHSSALSSALGAPAGRRALDTGRLLGLQANTSPKSPEELDGAQELEGEAPEAFASGMCALRDRFGLRVLGGCCGTDAAHISALAEGLARERRPRDEA
jgi:homocysteine S-methyltransferase